VCFSLKNKISKKINDSAKKTEVKKAFDHGAIQHSGQVTLIYIALICNILV